MNAEVGIMEIYKISAAFDDKFWNLQPLTLRLKFKTNSAASSPNTKAQNVTPSKCALNKDPCASLSNFSQNWEENVNFSSDLDGKFP